MALTFTWTDIDRMVAAVQDALSGRAFDGIVGIARSGLVPAVMLSHSMGIRTFGVLDIARTLSDEIEASKHEPRLRGMLNVDALARRHVLLVDDIVGAGETMLAARAQLVDRCASLTSVALVVNRANLGPRPVAEVVDHHAEMVSGWVVFPWEGK